MLASPGKPPTLGAPYAALDDHGIAQLALDPQLFAQLADGWALCPDHVVFLGPKAHVAPGPELVFVRGEGVYAMPGFNAAKLAQLRCYYDVLARHNGAPLATLTDSDVAALLNWDAEQYRMALQSA
jgi:rhamnose utilization protein RhaD (predicted bifunctional aldolase and dehydrogenase)